MAAKPLPTTGRIEGAATIVPVRDVAATAAFYADILGWEARDMAPDRSFCIVASGEAAICLTQTDDADALAATANNISVYVWVSDVDALYLQLAGRLGELPEGRVRPPFDQSYGMREFHVKDPDGCLLFFGEEAER
jgi:predicted enzyme related to lactoylglutathione lyase